MAESFLKSNAVFHVSQMDRSLVFYCDILGFHIDFLYGDPLRYAGLSRSDVSLHLSSQYPYQNNTGYGSLYMYMVGVEGFYNHLLGAGADFYSGMEKRDYGLIDFAIKDPDGNQIGFGQEF